MTMNIILERTLSELKLQHKTQSALADYLGVTVNVITDWKGGRLHSYNKYVYGIASFLNVSAEYLRGETDQKEKPLAGGDKELTEYLEELKNRDELRMLFSVTKDCTKEEVEQGIRIIEALRKKDD